GPGGDRHADRPAGRAAADRRTCALGTLCSSVFRGPGVSEVVRPDPSLTPGARKRAAALASVHNSGGKWGRSLFAFRPVARDNRGRLRIRHSFLTSRRSVMGRSKSACRIRRSFRVPLFVERLEGRVVPSFLPPVAFAVDGQPYSVAAGDVNGD